MELSKQEEASTNGHILLSASSHQITYIRFVQIVRS